MPYSHESLWRRVTSVALLRLIVLGAVLLAAYIGVQFAGYIAIQRRGSGAASSSTTPPAS